MKKFSPTIGNQKGSALLITLLMLGVLMTITLSISTLVIREIKVTQSIVDANKAYYAAEAGLENALLELANHREGYEPNDQPVSEEADSADKVDPTFSYDYSISSQTSTIPGFAYDKPIFVEAIAENIQSENITNCQISSAANPLALAMGFDQFYKDCPRSTYRKLALNETHIIPLFSSSDNGTEDVNDFLVEYYINVRDGSGLNGPFSGLDLEKFDILRWKIYGQPNTSASVQRTESIADFYPAVNTNSPDNPVCIGTNPNLRTAAEEICILPHVNVGSGSETRAIFSAARECYQTDAGVNVTGGALVKSAADDDGMGCSMMSFLDSHKENYLLLTNMVNPEVVGISNLKDPDQLRRADIYYRVIIPEDSEGKLVKDYAEITANGFARDGRVRKTLQVKYKAPSYLPVFNFSLYKTMSEPIINKMKVKDTTINLEMVSSTTSNLSLITSQ